MNLHRMAALLIYVRMSRRPGYRPAISLITWRPLRPVFSKRQAVFSDGSSASVGQVVCAVAATATTLSK